MPIADRTADWIDAEFSASILPTLIEYIRIPNKSPSFDPRELPFDAPAERDSYSLDVAGQRGGVDLVNELNDVRTGARVEGHTPGPVALL